LVNPYSCTLANSVIAISAIAGIVQELLKLYNLLMGRMNSPEMVQAKMNQLHQDLADRVNTAESVLADPNATESQKDAALNAIRLADS
jgi:hypothetical protein